MIKVTETELFEFLESKGFSSDPISVNEFFEWVRKKNPHFGDAPIKLIFKKSLKKEKKRSSAIMH